jgi:hypothetical protein
MTIEEEEAIAILIRHWNINQTESIVGTYSSVCRVCGKDAADVCTEAGYLVKVINVWYYTEKAEKLYRFLTI